MTSIWVYTSENHGTSIEVPLTPETTVSDVLDCVRDPVRGEGYLVAVAGDTEYILQEGDNAFTFLYQIWNNSGSPLTFLLRYYSQHAEWPPPELEARRHAMRRPVKDPVPVRRDPPDKLPGEVNDLTLAELQEMASRQQQQMEEQQQVLVAKEQRLKYLKQQEARHAQLASESERLRKIRERVESQELKLKKLRALKGQAEQYKSNNSNLNSELDAVRAVFNEKEKELAVAVARVDQLTRQLRDLRNGINLNLTGNQQAAAMAELEKLRKELLIRNKLNEQQSNTIMAKEKILQQRKMEVATMDVRIQELQQRLKKKKEQAAAQNKVNNLIPGNNEHYGQYGTQNMGSGLPKQDTRYQNVKINVAGKPEVESKFSKAPEMNNNIEGIEEYKLPSVLTTDSNTAKLKVGLSAPSVSQHPQPPVPLRSSFGKGNIDYVRSATDQAGQHNQPLRREARPLPMAVGKPGTKFAPMPPPRHPVSNPPAAGDAGKTSVSSSGLMAPGTSVHPIININEEERQAGSGQSSPASSEASTSSSGVKGDEVNTSSIGPVSALIERLNKNIGQPSDQSHLSSSQGSAGLIRPSLNQRPRLTSHENSGAPPTERQQGNIQTPTGSGLQPQSPLAASPGTEDTSRSSSGSQPLHSSNLHLNQKPAPTYRYASKNQIANTYMGRLGSAAMEKYQKNLNMLYKNLETDESRSEPQQEGTTSFLTSSVSEATKETPSSHNYPDIASDKGSYKLNTPKHIRRRHSDSENEDLNKALQEHQELEQNQRALGQPDANVSDSPNLNVAEANVSPVQLEVPNQVPNTPEKDKTTSSPTKEDKPLESPSPPSPVSPPPLPAVKSHPSKAEMVVRRGKSNLKQEGSRKSNNRVSFDPLALLLDASLEGEIELVKKVAVQVDDVSTPNDEGITALHNAICAGHLDIVVFLVEFGCDVNSPDSDGWTPLHCAASCNNLAMVKFLVEHGACVFATTISDHETAADKCEEEEDGYDGCSDYLYSIQEKMGITNSGEVYGVFDYQATNTDELSFQAGDKLTVLRKGDDVEKEWWWSSLNGNEGYIPRNLLGLYPRVTPALRDTSDC